MNFRPLLLLTGLNHLLHKDWDVSAARAKAWTVPGSSIAPDVEHAATSAADWMRGAQTIYLSILDHRQACQVSLIIDLHLKFQALVKHQQATCSSNYMLSILDQLGCYDAKVTVQPRMSCAFRSALNCL